MLFGTARTHKEAIKGIGAPVDDDAPSLAGSSAAGSAAAGGAAAAESQGTGSSPSASSSSDPAAEPAGKPESSPSDQLDKRAKDIGMVSDAKRHAALIDAIAFVLWQAALKGGDPLDEGLSGNEKGGSTRAQVVAIRTTAPVPPPLTADGFSSYGGLVRLECGSMAETRAAVDRLWNMDVLQGSSGVILLVLSLLLSRGVDGLQDEDRTDKAEPLVQRFGNCGQELVNLMLTGRGTSEVFDGEKDVGGGFMMKGIMSQPYVGYLTRLEFLRATKVGSYLKEPRFPAWVVGSESHFSVLFSTDPKACEPDPQSSAKRVFDKHDASSGGFIALEALPRVLEELELPIVS